LLLAATEDELRQVISLCERALSIERRENQENYAVLQFVQGLAAYREGKFDRAISILRGDASRVLGPAPRIVLAMAQHQISQIADARKTFAAAILAHDWSAIQVRDRNDWLFHTLRREAERVILPGLSLFLAGTYEPRDNDERFAMLGECLFANRQYALARLYADAFAVAPQVAMQIGAAHRHAAMRAAASVGSGDCDDCGNLSDDDRKRWRKQVYDWVRLDLSVGGKMIESGHAASRHSAWTALTRGLADPEFASLREPKALARLSVEERDEWIALWKEVETMHIRASSP
jgi:serine/threonine-protein kinase